MYLYEIIADYKDEETGFIISESHFVYHKKQYSLFEFQHICKMAMKCARPLNNGLINAMVLLDTLIHLYGFKVSKIQGGFNFKED